MKPISFKRHRFPAEVIRQAVRLCFRFTLSIRDVEERLAQRGIEVSRETDRCWVIEFGPLIAANLCRRRQPPTGRRHLDAMYVRIGGRKRWLWRAVDDEGEVLDVLVQKRRNKAAALKLLRRLLRNQGLHPETITTDKLASYGAAVRASESPPSMMLTCVGTDLEARAVGSTTIVTVTPGTDPGIGSTAHRVAVAAATASTRATTTPTYDYVRVPAHMSVSIDGASIKVRPSENNQPGFGKKKSQDGWYILLETAISDTTIVGKAGYGPTFGGKHRLAIDRQTGDAKFGDFRGVCERAATGPPERRF